MSVFVYTHTMPATSIMLPSGEKKVPFPKVCIQLKHYHSDTPSRSSIVRGIHPSEGLRTPVIKIEVEQTVARSELCVSESSRQKHRHSLGTLTLSSGRNSGLSISVSALKTSNFAWSAKMIASPTRSVNRRFRSPWSSAFSTKAVSVA